MDPTLVYRLETFGGLTLAGGGPRSLSHQRLRLALLALLAAAGERGLSRDQIVGLLWPEAESSAARHSLEQLLHALRRSLGDSVFTGVNPIALNGEVVVSDLAEFERAIQREDFAAAVALYRGPFLNGFYLDDAREFERWVETERARLAGRYLDALVRLAERGEQSGDHRAAVEWRKRVAETDPVSSRYALDYMRALAAAGDRGAALAHARVHESLIRQELETDPDPSIGAYVAALRAGSIEQNPAAAPRAPERVVDDVQIRPSSVTDGEATRRRVDDARRLIGRRTKVVAIAAVFALLAFGVWTAGGGLLLPRRDLRTLVVVPVRVVGADSTSKYQPETIADLLSFLLTGEGGLRAVDSRTAIYAWNHATAGHDGTADDARRVARELGAGQALFGTLVVTPAQLTLSANILDPDGGERQPAVRVTAPADSLPSLIDAFVRQLLGRRSGMPEQTLATLTTVSMPALFAYLDGRAAHRQAHDQEAIRDFTRALEIDSTFALAGLDLAVATLRILRQGVCNTTPCHFGTVVTGLVPSVQDDGYFETGVRLAWQARDKLGPYDRARLEVLRGPDYPQPSSARETLAKLEAADRTAPKHAETQYLMGVVMLFQGAALDYADALQRAEGLFANALRLDSSYLAPLARLVEVAGHQHDAAKLRLYASRYLARDPAGATADFVRWRVAVGTNDASGLRAIRARFDSLEATTLRQIMSASQVDAVALEDAEAASAQLLARSAQQTDRIRALYDAHMLALNRGRPQRADSLLRERRKARADDNAFWQTATLAAIYGQGRRETVEEFAQEKRDRLAAQPLDSVRPNGSAGATITARALLSQAAWDYDRGDTAAVTATLRRLDEHDGAWLGDVVRMLRATDERRRDAPALRARVDTMAREGCCGRAPVYVNLILARAFERAGDDASALRALRRIRDEYFLASALKEEGLVASRLKDYAGARHAFERYLALRSDPETALRAERDSIQALADRLPRGR